MEPWVWVIIAVAAVLGVGLAGIGLAPNLEIALVLLITMGTLVGFASVRLRSWLQARVPDEVRGRVMSLVMLGSFGTAPFSLAAAGVLVDAGLTTAMFIAAGAIMIGAAILGVVSNLQGLMIERETATG